MIIEWIGREQQYAISNVGLKWKKPIRYAMYYAILVTIFWFAGKEQQVIYFQSLAIPVFKCRFRTSPLSTFP